MTNREQEANNALQSIAKDIKEKLPENMGFALLAYEFGEAEDKRMLYVSNSNREDVMKAMIEFLEKNVNDPAMFGKDV
jgi:hypothetical protein